MRKVTFAVVIVSLAVLAGAPAHAAADHRVLMSNFRFCPERPFPCDPLDIGYAPNPAAGQTPAAAVFSPITTVAVKPGDTVTFVYSEPLCDNGVFCPPHTVTFVDGSFKSPDTTSGTIVYTVPLDAKPGTFAFYCRFHAGAGMTGALTVG